MKKLFFSLLAFAACALTASAQQEPANGSAYYLYNTETGKFLGRGASWGTQAIVTDYGMPWQVDVANGKYKLHMLDIVKADGNANRGLNTGGFTDTNPASEFAYEGSSTGYTLPISINNDMTVNAGSGTSTWQFLSHEDYLAVIAAKQAAQNNKIIANTMINATASTIDAALAADGVTATPIDVPAINNANWNPTKVSNRGGNQNQGTYGVESYQTGDAKYSHTLTGLKKGIYKVGIKAMVRSTSNAACYAVGQLGFNGSEGYLDANGYKVNIKDWYSSCTSNAVPNSTGAFVEIANNGGYYSEVYTYVGEDGKLAITAASPAHWGACWFLMNSITVTYYEGYELAVSEELANALIASAPTGKMNFDVKSVMNDAIIALEQSRSIANYEALQTAIANAEASAAVYAQVAAINAKAAALDDAGQAAYASTLDAYNEGELTVGTEVADAQAAYIAAIKSQTTPGLDWTELMVNADFEMGNLTGWTSVDGGNIATNTNYNTSKFVERWKNGVALGNGSLTHDAITLPAGLYTLKIDAQNIEQYNNNAGGKGLFLRAAGEEVEIGARGIYSMLVKLNEETSVTIAVVQDNCTGNWVSYDNFQIIYEGQDFPALPALAEGKMNAEIAQAQTDAIAAFEADKTVANYNAALAAIEAAQTSKAQYETAAANLTKANEILNSTNVYTAEARTAYETAISGVQAKYDDNTLAAADMADVNAIVGPANYNKPKNVMTTYVASAWSATNGVSVYTNDWSWEGGQEGNSGLTTPFIENWVADANKLANTEVSATMTDLENGLYRITADVRLMNSKTGENAGFDGITFFANSEAPAMPEATTYPDGNLYKISIEALVKDGNLKMGYTVENTNVSWVAMKNVKYTKVRDLTPAEEAVTPTGIALDKTEVTLTAAENTVTLAPIFTPENATETVTWETSDANVATVVDGVVTGVAPGTATITVKSSLDETVKATCEVTVEYDETEYEKNIELADANPAAINVSVLGDNIIKNGSFEYPNGVANWTAANNAAMTIGNFQIGEEDGNHYLKATANAGGSDAKSIGTAWAIEAGKTYVFSYKVKNGSNGNSQYHKVSLTNTPGTETKQVSVDATPVTTDWTTVSYQFTNSDNYQFVQFRGRWLGNSVCFDDFYLAEVTETSQIGNVDYAKSQIPTNNVGDGAFQYSQSAIDAANALVKGTATVEDVELAAAAVKTLNAPADGQKFNIVLTFAGWTYDNKAITYIANGRNDAGLYNIQYKAEVNANYAQAFTMTQVEGNKYKMSQTDNDGVERYISTGVPYGGNTAQIRTTIDAEKALVVEVIATATDGVYNIKNTEANQYIGSQDAGVYTVNSHIDFNIVEATKATATIAVSDAKWATFIAPFDVTIPADIEAYSCEAKDENNVLTLVQVETTIPANTPVILNAAEAVDGGSVEGWGLATKDEYTAGWLTGTYVDKAVGEGCLMLAKKDGVVAFYSAPAGRMNKAGKAYLTLPAEAKATALYFPGDADAIQAIEALANGNAKIYDLNGRQQNKLQKGINIVNGHKVMVK